MDQTKTGALIRALRLKREMTQLELAQRVGVSDKAVSKWERGCGAPDVSLLPQLAQALSADVNALLSGQMEENAATNGDMRKLRFYICPECGNLAFSTDEAGLVCCGRRLEAASLNTPDEAHRIRIADSDGEWFVEANHEMTRTHCISFVALLSGDALIVRRLYPEWSMQARLPRLGHGRIVWYCTRHGLFYQNV